MAHVNLIDDPSHPSVIFGDYVAVLKLGERSPSTIWRARRRSTEEEVVVKRIDLSKLNRHLRSCLDCEIGFLSSVKHPNIIRLLDVFQEGQFLFMILEFCDGGDLASYIRRHGRVQEHTARRFMQQLGAGMEIIHANHLIHRDLKPENILLSRCESDLLLKIADFGLSRKLQPGKHIEVVCGSPFYMAPEVLQFQRYDQKADMWSVGAILFELLNGYPPFCGINNVQVLRNIRACSSLPFSQLIIGQLHPDCIDMCSRLLSVNPVSRLSFDEFYRHGFLRVSEDD